MVDITEEGVLTHAGPELAEEWLQLSEVTRGGGDDVVTATATATTHRYQKSETQIETEIPESSDYILT